jgi:hypothetical protein
MKLIEKDTNKDAIIAYLKSEDDEMVGLTEKQKSLLKYYMRAYDLIRSYNSTPDVIKVLVKLSVELGEPISQSTARRYIQDAQNVFGYADKTKAEAIKHYCSEVYKDAIGMAWRQNNPDAMTRAADKLNAMAGKDPEQPFNAEMMEQHIIEINLDDQAQQVVHALTAHGNIDLDAIAGNLLNHMADDAQILDDEEQI